MLAKSYEVYQKESYVSTGFREVGLLRELEQDSDMWSIDPQTIMPYRARIMTGVTQISDGNYIRAQFGSKGIS